MENLLDNLIGSMSKYDIDCPVFWQVSSITLDLSPPRWEMKYKLLNQLTLQLETLRIPREELGFNNQKRYRLNRHSEWLGALNVNQRDSGNWQQERS